MWNPVNYQQFGIPTAMRIGFDFVNGGAVANDLILHQYFYDAQGNLIGQLTYSYDGNNNLTGIQRVDNQNF